MSLPMLSKPGIAKISYALINIVLAIAQLCGAFSVWGLVRTVVLLLVVGYIILVKSDDGTPACAFLPLLFAMQCAIALAIHFDQIVVFYDPNAAEQLSVALSEHSYFGLFALVGAGLFLLGCIYRNHTGLTGAGIGVLGIGFFLSLWSTGKLDSLQFSEHGQAVVVAFALCAVLWVIAIQVATVVKPSMKTECIVFGVVLLVAAIVINVSCRGYVLGIASELDAKLLALPDTLFAWWIVLIACVALVALAVVVRDEREWDSMGADAFVLGIGANILFAVRVLMSNYFVHSWMIALLEVLFLLHALCNGVKKRDTLPMRGSVMLVVTPVVFVVAAHLLCWGLVANVVVTLVFIALFYRLWPRMEENTSGNLLWISVVSCLVAEALARLGTWRYSVEGCLMLVLVWAMAVAVILILNRKHPAGVVPNSVMHFFVALLVGVVCLCSLRSPIGIGAQTQGNEVEVSVEVGGEGNQAQVTYAWSDALGREVVAEESKPAGTQKVPIASEVLVVKATDSRGVTCTRKFFYAPWVHGFDSSVRVSGENTSVEAAPVEGEQAAEGVPA